MLQRYNLYSKKQHVKISKGDASLKSGLLSDYRKRIIHDIQTRQLNIEAMTVFLSVVQESQELLSALRHLMRGENKIEE